MVTGLRSDEVVPLGPSIKAHPSASSPRSPSPHPGPDLAGARRHQLLRAFACASNDPTRAVLRSACLDTSGTGKRPPHRWHQRSAPLLEQFHAPAAEALGDPPGSSLWKWKPLAEARPWTLRLGKDKHQAEYSAWKANAGAAWSVTDVSSTALIRTTGRSSRDRTSSRRRSP